MIGLGERAAEDRDQHEERDHDPADERRLVLAEALPEELDGRLPRDSDGLWLRQRDGAPRGHLEFGRVRHPRRKPITASFLLRQYCEDVDRIGFTSGRAARRADRPGRADRGAPPRRVCGRPPSAIRRSTASRTCTRSASTAGSTWRSRRRPRSRSSSTSTGVPVGSTRYLNIEPFHRRAEIGWTWLERAAVGDRREHRDEVPAAPERVRPLRALMRVEFKTDARNLRVRGALLGIGGDVRGDLPQAHGAAGLDPRLGLVRDRRRRLAAGASAMLEAKIERHAA